MHRQRITTTLFAATIFVGAFLLFQVQPLIGKYILPWFGGSPAVWTTCMLFFQVMLLAGYAYAHASVKWLAMRGQVIFHLMLVAIAVSLLPIIPAARWMPVDASRPALRILGLLTVSVGAPYFVLAATAPLLQGWFSRVLPGRSPYRLYALSNSASLLALLSYPFVLEPMAGRVAQASLWGGGLCLFAVLCAGVAVTVISSIRSGNSGRTSIAATASPQTVYIHSPITTVLWIALPACASALMLAITNKICQDVAVVPLLWVLPLTIYLLTFIVAFDSPRWYVRPVFTPLMALALAAVCYAMFAGPDGLSVVSQVEIYCLGLFACAMVCHGELYRLRPPAEHLTSFYLMIALGGAIGGALVAVVAPLLFNGYFELHISLFAAAVLSLFMIHRNASIRRPILLGIVSLGVVVLGVALLINATQVLKDAKTLARSRNFYGVLAVYDVDPRSTLMHRRILQHGGVAHGLQFYFPPRHDLPTAYYAPDSGIGIALRNVSRAQGPLRVGVVGLGVGTVASYGQSGDVYRFYEINPDVLGMANEYFSFLHDSPAKVQIELGDARMTLQRESPQQYDVLVLDAFSGDSIPVHLLTKECFDVYLKHLRPGGVIAVHISNQHLDFAPVVMKLAEHFNLHAAQIISPARPELGEYLARWMLLSTNADWIDSPAVRSAATPLPQEPNRVRLWTDDDTNLFQILN